MREDTNEVSANEMLLIFESNPVNEGLARVTAASFCTQLNPTLEEIADLKTAVSEAVTNCIIHGYEGRRGRIEMHLSYREQAQMLILELLADGKRMPSAELEKAVNERGISSRTMRTAKSRIGDRLVTEKDGTVWVCYLRD